MALLNHDKDGAANVTPTNHRGHIIVKSVEGECLNDETYMLWTALNNLEMYS